MVIPERCDAAQLRGPARVSGAGDQERRTSLARCEGESVGMARSQQVKAEARIAFGA